VGLGSRLGLARELGSPGLGLGSRLGLAHRLGLGSWLGVDLALGCLSPRVSAGIWSSCSEAVVAAIYAGQGSVI